MRIIDCRAAIHEKKQFASLANRDDIPSFSAWNPISN